MLRFYEKSVYGKILIYPDESIAHNIEKLTGKKTLTETQIQHLYVLGCNPTIDRLPQ